MEAFEIKVWGNPLLYWFFSVLVVAGVWFVWLLLGAAMKKKEQAVEAEPMAAEGETVLFFRAVFSKIKWFFVLIISVYLGSLVLTLPVDLERFLLHAVYIVFLVQVGILGSWGIARWAQKTFKEKKETDAAQATAMGVLKISFICLLWLVLVLAALGDIGFDITTLVAGLGVGGIAVALAAQKILGDLFASATIIMDKPFAVGDFIIVGDVMGNVENIGLKTTRIRSLSGEQLILPNSDLLENHIRNFQRMKKRRVLITLGVVYQTALEKLRVIPGMLREIIESQGQVKFDRAHFKEYGPHSLNFELVYHVLTRDYDIHMDIQQAVNLAIYERFQQAGIEFAYPTQTIFLNGSQSGAPAD